jgi:capsular exopolysaccharide synthesis family protein
LGKFFEAMQRATTSSDEASPGTDHKNGPPDLDESLLQPERPGVDEPFPEAVHSEFSTTVIAAEEHPIEETSVSVLHAVDTAGPEKPHSASEAPQVLEQERRESSVPLKEPIVTRNLVDSAVFRSPVHAAYERIIQRLLKFRRTPRESVILVTSSISGEGASTVARNTAVALARRETEQVLLVDANFRSPSQHVEFGLEREIGLSDVLMGATTVTAAIEKDDVSEISIMTAGSKVPSPAQLLSSAGLQSVIMAVLSLYDWVIIDGPAATSYPDASSIATACGGTVLVIEAESTRSEVIDEAKRNLEAAGAEVLGAVLNRRRYHIPNFIYRRL